MDLAQLILYFTIYSVLGWVCECIYCSIPAKKFVNRGLLFGPYCPIYGFGALLIITLLSPLGGNAAAIFFFGMILTSILEYCSSFLLEQIFHMQWWDYSAYFFNLHGRVCLLNSTLFGLLAVMLLFGIHPPTQILVEKLSVPQQIVAAILCSSVLLTDTIFSVKVTLQASGRLERIHLLLEEMKEKNELLLTHTGYKVGSKLEYLLEEGLEETKVWEEKLSTKLEEFFDTNIEAAHAQALAEIEGLQADLSAYESKEILPRRLREAFPTMRSKRYAKAMEYLKTQRNRK